MAGTNFSNHANRIRWLPSQDHLLFQILVFLAEPYIEQAKRALVFAFALR